ncbi:DUF1592 domain-containing protein [Rubinisphaera margarita]|uniref:DUF1592 domain-containing protein n=1 Tax=Rubinisphaera margarita TaxID=2909586 RepID=UPI001EE9A483|nr:DUF1592 domain-containing protein [Rubinisphaera margarita]MCG6156359.1 DUF1592 domain-containing protein [Rubinisphaera margarita]
MMKLKRHATTYAKCLIVSFSWICLHSTSRADVFEVNPVQRALIYDFLTETCLDCHQGEFAEANFRIDELKVELDERHRFRDWELIYDRIVKGEMPPEDAEQPSADQRESFVQVLDQTLVAASRASQQNHGRTQFRRMNRVEYEHTLRDLLSLPELEVREMLPPDGEASGFDTVGSALELSYVQIARYLQASNAAIDEAMVKLPPPEATRTFLEAKTNGRFSQVLNKRKEAVPIGNAVGLLRQPNTAQAPWWWSKFAPPIDGYYRLRMKTFGFLWDRGKVLPADRKHAVTFHAVLGTTKRPLGTFDVGSTSDEASIHDFTAYLRQGDQIQIWFETLDDRNKGQRELDEYTAPGVAVEWLEVEGPLQSQWPPESHRRMFGDFPLEPWTPESGVERPPVPIIVNGVGKRAQYEPAKLNNVDLLHVIPDEPAADARKLLVDFARRAFRRPVQEEELDDVYRLVKSKLDNKESFQEAMRIGFQSVLCSPDFLYFQEHPGRLDDYALADRLSYFLWKSMPDQELLQLAESGRLNQSDVLRKQVERMLDDPKSSRFVEDFCGQWLDLREITTTQPDEVLYPEFDQFLLDSMVRETHAYFRTMLRDDLGVQHLIDSDFAMINSRLAELYDIPNVEGVQIRQIALPTDSPRGGLWTQASILKVTANGTTTSPVTRGAWVLDRIYGEPVPLPPANVPAIEPDLRGATTIRDQLEKHRSDTACAGCHRSIDPPGFALESFDVIGGWRGRYRSLGEGDPVKRKIKDDQPVRYRWGPLVESHGVAPNGRQFDDIHGLREILLLQQNKLAHNLASRLLVYATGAEIEFADRPVIAEIVKKSHSSHYGLRTLVHNVVQSDTFQMK